MSMTLQLKIVRCNEHRRRARGEYFMHIIKWNAGLNWKGFFGFDSNFNSNQHHHHHRLHHYINNTRSPLIPFQNLSISSAVLWVASISMYHLIPIHTLNAAVYQWIQVFLFLSLLSLIIQYLYLYYKIRKIIIIVNRIYF